MVAAETQSSLRVPGESITPYRLSKDPFMGVTMEMSATCRCVRVIWHYKHACWESKPISVRSPLIINVLLLFSCCVKRWEKKEKLVSVETEAVERFQK